MKTLFIFTGYLSALTEAVNAAHQLLNGLASSFFPVYTWEDLPLLQTGRIPPSNFILLPILNTSVCSKFRPFPRSDKGPMYYLPVK